MPEPSVTRRCTLALAYIRVIYGPFSNASLSPDFPIALRAPK
nr:MAG TPA: hypothetical protein [Caudoviricetes sp.]